MRDRILPGYSRLRAQYQDSVLFWRVGDFYKVFNGDAVKVSECLDTTLLIREGVPITGGLWHSLSAALARLRKAGYKVAVCEPRQKSGEYEVVRIVSPGLDRELVEAAGQGKDACRNFCLRQIIEWMGEEFDDEKKSFNFFEDMREGFPTFAAFVDRKRDRSGQKLRPMLTLILGGKV